MELLKNNPMAAKKKAKVAVDVQETEASVTDAIPTALVMPISELLKLSKSEQQAFRTAGGTSTEG